MMDEILQLRLDQALATHRQRWVLGAVVVGASMVATAFATIGTNTFSGVAVAMLITAAVAVVAASGSGTHTGSIVIAIVALEWVIAVDDVGTPRSIGTASGLYVFHSLLALMASSPHTSAIDTRVLRQWGRRSLVVMSGTVAVWGLVAVLAGRRIDGSPVLTVLGLAVLAAALIVARREIFAPERTEDAPI